MVYGGGLKQSLYFSLPYLTKSWIATVYGLVQRRERYGTVFHHWLECLKKSQYDDNIRLIQDLLVQRDEFYAFAREQSPYYNGRDNAVSSFEELSVIRKEDLRINRDKITVPVEAKKARMVHTSGTSGASLQFPLTQECFQREYAFRAMHYHWAGIDVLQRPRIATFSGHPVAHPSRKIPPYWVNDYCNNWLLFSSYHITRDTEKWYAGKLFDFDPVAIHGYPSTVYLIALAVKKHKKSINSLKAIFTASESLSESQRRVIEDAFQVKVYNWYGNTEMCANIVECAKGRLHLKLEHSFVEILDDNDKKVIPGGTGRLICTGIGNKAFPLIRYDIGDMVTISKEERCPCGRGGILIESIDGRKEDYIITQDGKKIGRLDHLFKDTTGIREAQIVQENTNEVILNIVPTEAYSSKDEKQLLDECFLRFGGSIKVHINRVSEIPRGANGKFKFIVSKLPQRRDQF